MRRRLVRLLMLFLIIAVIPPVVLSPVTARAGIPEEAWNRTFTAHNSMDDAYAIQQTSDGGYILAGFANYSAARMDAMVVKTDSNGRLEWRKTFGGASRNGAYAIQQTSDGGYVFAGSVTAFGHGLSDAWLVKLNKDGTQEWSKTYGESDFDWANTVQQTRDGGYILAGATILHGEMEAWLVKTDPEGNMVWNRTYGSAGYNEAITALQPATDGGYIIAVWIEYSTMRSDVRLIKTDSKGNVVWAHTYGGSANNIVQAVQPTRDGGYILAGVTTAKGAGASDAWLIKIDSKGKVIWDHTYGGAGRDEAWDVIVTDKGDYVIAGITGSYGAGVPNAWLVKVDGSGREFWNITSGGALNDGARALQQTPDGGYILAGYTNSYTKDKSDFWLIKVAITDIVFDTGAVGTYPSIPGIHKGVIIPRQDMNITKLYTYSCPGTAGHTESIKLFDANDKLIATGKWHGYHNSDDWHNLTLYNTEGTPGIKLLKGHRYSYIIHTGSYPQIIHEQELKTLDGSTIRCTEFKDINGRVYNDWIPAIRFYE